MRPSAMFRRLSLRIPARLFASPAVTPLPIPGLFDQQVSAGLNTLHSATESNDTSTATWLLRTLEVSIVTQKIALGSLANVTLRDSDYKTIDEYLDDSVQMLDACNCLMEKIEILRKYVESLRVVAHVLDGQNEPTATALVRAQDELESCEEMERRGRQMDMGKLLNRLAGFAPSGTSGTAVSELGEILCGSKLVALMACRFLGFALSFKSKRWIPKTAQSRPPMTSWLSLLLELQKKGKVESEKRKGLSSSMTLTELRMTAMAARELRVQIKLGKKDKLGVAVEELQRNSGKMGESIDALEGGVKELYKILINVRMALLGILSQA